MGFSGLLRLLAERRFANDIGFITKINKESIWMTINQRQLKQNVSILTHLSFMKYVHYILRCDYMFKQLISLDKNAHLFL